MGDEKDRPEDAIRGIVLCTAGAIIGFVDAYNNPRWWVWVLASVAALGALVSIALLFFKEK